MNLIKMNEPEEEIVFTCENLFQYISTEELWVYIKTRVIDLKEIYSSNQKVNSLITNVERELNRIQCSYNLTRGGFCD